MIHSKETIFQQEIEYRKSLLSKACQGVKLTPQERSWLRRHAAFNHRLGYPYYNTDVLELESRKEYLIRVQFESADHPEMIAPYFSVADGKGQIAIPDGVLADIHGEVTKKMTTKRIFLATLGCQEPQIEFRFQSQAGFMEVGFGCNYYDSFVNLHKQEASDTWNSFFAMIKEELGENKVRYKCKSPISETFDSLIFTVQWDLIR